jgi:hypothetical protein
MTIASTVSKTPTYACNGVTVSFPYEFRILSSADMTVILEDEEGVQTTLVLGVDYSLSGVGAEDGGTITTFTAYATGNKITGIRSPSFLQGVDLQNQGAFFAQVIEDALDLAAMRDQALAARIGNAIRAPDTETVEMVLPSAALRANKYMLFDANGEPSYADTQIDTRYYGALTSDPATRPDGSAREAGDAYFNSVSLEFRVFSGTAWQEAIPTADLTLVNFTETAASAKTTFTITGGYAVGSSFAYLNGVLLAPDEVTLANGTTAVLSSACAIGDEFRLVSYSAFSVADTLSRASNLNDVPDKPTALTNLGFSAFVQGLRGILTAPAFRTALGLAFGATAPLATQALAEAGANNTDLMTPLRTKQAIDAQTGVKFLGSVTTPSGSVRTLSGLDLTPYRQVQAWLDNVDPSTTTTAGALGVGGTSLGSTTSDVTAFVLFDLLNGRALELVENENAIIEGHTLTTASTSISVTTTQAFSGGSVRFYGIR